MPAAVYPLLLLLCDFVLGLTFFKSEEVASFSFSGPLICGPFSRRPKGGAAVVVVFDLCWPVGPTLLVGVNGW